MIIARLLWCPDFLVGAVSIAKEGRNRIIPAISSIRPTSSAAAVNIHHMSNFTHSRRQSISTIIFSNVYPDITASAACVRTQSLLKGLITSWKNDSISDNNCDAQQENNIIYYATSAKISPEKIQSIADNNNIHLCHLPSNDTDAFEKIFPCRHVDKEVVTSIPLSDIDLVIFDRFYMEEAYSFRFMDKEKSFERTSPLVLDMQDMHSLRWGRQGIVEEFDQSMSGKQEYDPFECLQQVLDYIPCADDEKLLRELASINRCDMTLVCSPYEMNILENTYGIPKEKLCLASFFVDINDILTNQQDNEYVVAPQYIFVGGFKHAPNVDAVHMLLEYIWPIIHSKLPKATLHIYGAYCPSNLQRKYNTNSYQTGIFIHGYESDLNEIYDIRENQKILLAPIRFGAGIKGKIIDAWTYGMPVVTTPVGSEGMTLDVNNDSQTDTNLLFGGRIESTLEGFCQSAVEIANCPTKYRQAQLDGHILLQKLFSAQKNWNHVQSHLAELLYDETLKERRQKDYTRAILWHQSNRSTEYFSRWIELKRKSKMTD